MNITGQATTGSIWQRIKVQHIALICGLTVAVSAALAAGGWEARKGNSASTATRAPEVPVYQSSETPRIVFFIVGSKVRAAELEAANAQEQVDPGFVPQKNLSLHILVADSAESESSAQSLISEAAKELIPFGISVETVDLRGR